MAVTAKQRRPSGLVVLLLNQLASIANADLPVHCLQHDIVGEWELSLGPRSRQRSSCGHARPDDEDNQPEVVLPFVQEKKHVVLQHHGIARTQNQSRGTWTMVYDEGFEVLVDGLSFFAFSRFEKVGRLGRRHNVSYCDRTQLGWYRDAARREWGCFFGRKVGSKRSDLVTATVQISDDDVNVKPVLLTPAPNSLDAPITLEEHAAVVAKLNNRNASWRARVYQDFVGKSRRELNKMAGLRRGLISRFPPVKSDHRFSFSASRHTNHALSFLTKRSLSCGRSCNTSAAGAPATLPESWDWRTARGAGYLDPVANQGACGSCYAIAAIRMLSARHRISKRSPGAEPFSIMFPLHCAEYNQGCGGGYAYLATKWSSDVGLLPFHCMPHRPHHGRCELQCSTKDIRQTRYRATNHRYVGGYYGMDTEAAMLAELYHNGPLVVSFEPTESFLYYGEGIYSTGISEGHNAEWEKVDHTVLLVGYGEKEGEAFWTLQNSWGANWGEAGFFRFLRGTDENGIESMAVAGDVVEDQQPFVLEEFLELHLP